jgi:alkylation response protein AidB-like acyl-CoA dehydrogenase
MTASAERLEDDETTLVRSTAAQIARRCRDTQGAAGGRRPGPAQLGEHAGDHRGCWDALLQAGFAELRVAGEEDQPVATATQTAAVIEELSRSVCGGQLLSHVLACELVRLSGSQLPAEIGDSGEPVALVLNAEWQEPGGVGGVAWDSSFSTWAVGVIGDDLAVFSPGEPVGPADLSRSVRRVAAPQVPSLGGAGYSGVRSRFLPFAWTMLTADLAGCAAGVLDDAVAYVQDRHQFGVPVGSFQAVQHLGAGAFVLVEAIRSSLLFAALALDGPPGGSATRDALVAKSFASDAAVQVAEAAIQMFGGVAITWEFPAHRYLRRVLADREIFGNAENLNAQLVTLDREAL